jgi:PIN domain nuclease of toxin-antitoxin system
MAGAVLDSSAVLAWLQRERGEQVVEPLLADSVMSAVIWCEILQKALQKQRDPEEVGSLLKGLGLQVVALNDVDALAVARLWPHAPHLSLADRCCLALAARFGIPAVTADGAWAGLRAGPKVVVIR